MNFPLQLCEERDPKGLYKLARAGKIKGMNTQPMCFSETEIYVVFFNVNACIT